MLFHEKGLPKAKGKLKEKKLLKGLVVVNINHTLGLFRLNLNDHFVSAIVLLKLNLTNKRTNKRCSLLIKTKGIKPQS